MLTKPFRLVRECGVGYALMRAILSLARHAVGRWISYSVAGRCAGMAAKPRITGWIFMENPARIEFGRGCLLCHGVSLVSESQHGRLVLGEDVQLNAGARVDYSGNVWIGQGSLISSGTAIYSHSHGYDPRSAPIFLEKRIGRNVWIGAGAILTENVRLVGDNSMIAAGAIVTKDVPPNAIVAGNPARVVRMKA